MKHPVAAWPGAPVSGGTPKRPARGAPSDDDDIGWPKS